MKVIELTEYITKRFPGDDISAEIGTEIWRQYGNQISIEFPSPKTAGEWLLTCQGWVGYIHLTDNLGLSLRPKANIVNLFRMLEYAYRLNSFKLLEGFFDCQTLEEFYERLAHILCLRTLDRGRKGFYRDYLPYTDRLPFVRGRLDVRHLAKAWDVKKECHYHEYTPDLEENQILTWTLLKITRSNLCREQVGSLVRKAYRELQKIVFVKAFTYKDCIGRLYNRLNYDYELLHILCRFFLENTGPTHNLGNSKMIPFLVNMGRLFELFVEEWLRINLPDSFALESQEEVSISNDGSLHFDIDLVLYDAASGDPVCVLDTKYKISEKPATEDIAQIAAYANSKNCSKAFLIYPTPLITPQRAQVGKIEIRCLTFELSGDLEASGRKLLDEIIKLQ